MRPRSLAALLIAVLAFTASAAQAFRVAVISDLNDSYGSTEYADRVSDAVAAIIALEPDLVISTGDMVAGQRRPTLSAEEVRAMWAAFHATVTDPLQAAGIPLAVTPGNHDASGYDGFEEERAIYGEEWRARRPDLDWLGTGNYPFHYAFDAGGLRFVSLDATRIGPLDRVQMSWLADTLASGPPAVVFGHLPLWAFAQGRETEIIADPKLESLFQDTGVTLVLSGHHHAYYPGAAHGLALVSQACLGAGPRPLIDADATGAQAFTLLDIDAQGNVAVSAYSAEDFSRPIDPRDLPERLETFEVTIDRLDLAAHPRVTTGVSR